jgi:hypothetical protein
MSNKLKLTFKSEMLPSFIENVKDLLSISDSIKMKMDKDNILIYSTLGAKTMLAFKSNLLNTKDYIADYDNINHLYDVIIANCGAFINNLQFIENNKKISIEFTYKDLVDSPVKMVRSMKVIGDRLKINWLGAETFEVRDISKQKISQMLSVDNIKWFFTLSGSDFDDIKKLSKINSDSVIDVRVKNGVVIMCEKTAWEIEVDRIEENINNTITINKRFLKSIKSTDSIIFNMFDNFILVNSGETNLILSYEQDFNEI